MGREIKFRAWDKEKNEMFNSPIEIEHLGSWFDAHLPGSLADKENIVIEQYTGLKDKNGVDIYEGDILYSNNVYYKIQWENGKAVEIYILNKHKYKPELTEMYFLFHVINSIEIGGNIHENPELLEV